MSESWGWRDDFPQGGRIGWVDDTGIYLTPNAAMAAASEQARKSGNPFTRTQRMFAKCLFEAGLLAERDEERGVYTVRRHFAGRRASMLHLVPDALGERMTAQAARELRSAETVEALIGSDELGG